MIMCKNNDYINKAIVYISSILHEKVSLSPVEKQLINSIPVAFSQRFVLYRSVLLEHDVIFAFADDNDGLTPAQMKRTLNLLENKCGCPVIWITDNIVSYNVGRLIAQRVNFIIPQKQMFIPSLLIDLKKEKTIGTDITEVIPSIAQCIILYHIEMGSVEGKQAEELSDIFHVSYATINRALRWLHDKKLIQLEGVKTKRVRMIHTKKDLWKIALPLLVSPLEKTVFSDIKPDNGLECGINALSEYTMINREDRDMYAFTKMDIRNSEIKTDKKYGTYRIEIWRYDPKLLTHSEVVDKLSLYLSLVNHEDERVQIELDKLIADIQW